MPIATARVEHDAVVIEVGGRWRLRAPRPEAATVLRAVPDGAPARFICTARGLVEWDSSLLLFLVHVCTHAADRKIPCELRDLPPVVTEWIQHMDTFTRPAPVKVDLFPVTRRLGRWAQGRADHARLMLAFLGECVLGLARAVAHPRSLRGEDCIFQMRRCGAQALGIVALITFLVGVILAFVGATQFRNYGADIFVADLVGLAIFREMGPMMAAVVLAGRTGAAYAAELGNMRLNEEIDALTTFGLRPVDFLVLPRLVALALMMPLLAVYADFFGVLGGGFVCSLAIDMSATTYFHRLQEAIALHSFAVGVLKSFFFGLIIAYSGCLKGMNAGRSAIGVGEATTSAVVLSILLIIIADAIFTVVFHVLGW